MIKTGILLVEVSDQDLKLEKLDLLVIMKRAVRIEERMVKGVNITDEQRRYHILCDRIEYYGQEIVSEKEVKTCRLSPGYLELLAKIIEKENETAHLGRLTANFATQDLVAKRGEVLQDLRRRMGLGSNSDLQKAIEFYLYASKNKLNVIELHEVESEDEDGPATHNVSKDFLALRVRDTIVVDDETNSFVALRNQIKTVVNSVRSGTAGAINFSDLRHDVIAEILFEYAYGRGSKVLAPVMYADGSRANDFPLYCLRTRGKEAEFMFKDEPVLNVGMMSERHPELDPKIKIYWFRNQEISIGKTAAEIDEVAYRKAKELFVKMRDEGVYKIAFYQTGFQPAVVGFYRALTEELIFRSTSMAKLLVTPYYFINGEYRVGKTWV